MNDLVVLGICFGIVCFCLMGLVYASVYGGVNDTLANARIGDVYNFRYLQPLTGEYHRYLAKVVDVYKLTNAQIAKLNWNSNYRSSDKNFYRSNTLVTCLMNDGTFRQFYAERSDMCKRTPMAKIMFELGVAHMF